MEEQKTGFRPGGTLPNKAVYPESAVLSKYLFLVPVDVSDSSFHHLLYSPLSGTLDFLDDSAASHVQQLKRGAEKVDLDSQLDRELWDRGYLFETPAAELRQSHMLYNELLKFHRDLQRHQIAVIPTYTCNLECVYCWQDRSKLPANVMDVETVALAFRAVDKLVEGVDPNDVDICFFGGEPLQADGHIFNAVKCIVEQSERRKFRVKAITNGVNLKEYLPFLGGSLDVVQVTLDGPESVHEGSRRGQPGDFWKIIESIDRALAAGVLVNIRVNVAPVNIDFIPDLARFVEDRWGADGPKLHLSPVKGRDTALQCNEISSLKDLLFLSDSSEMPRNVGLTGYRAVRDISYLLHYDKAPLQRFFSCEAQLNFWALDAVGDIYVCFDACGNPQLSVGRFLPELEINETQLGKWRGRSSLNSKRCTACTAAPICSGGCAFVEATREGGSCDRLMDSYPIVLKHYAKAIYEMASRSSSKTVGFISSGESSSSEVR